MNRRAANRGRQSRTARTLARLSGIAVDLSPVRESRPYRYLLAGQSIALLGRHMRIVALAWQVYAITSSSVAVGLLGLTEVIPLLALSSYAGAVADSHDRKRLMWWAQAGSVVASLALAALTIVDAPSLILIYALSAAASSCDAFDSPARMAIVPSLVGWERIAPAFALRQIIFQLSQIAGPAIGGVLIGAFSVGAVYLVDAAAFLVSMATLRAVPSQAPVVTQKVSRFEAVKEGVRWAWGRRLLRSIFLVDLSAMVFGMPRALFPELAVDVFHIGASGVGLLYAAPAVGALGGALLSGWISKVSKQGIAIFLSVIGWGAAVTLAGATLPYLFPVLLFLTLAGIADVLSAVFRGTMLQQSTPDELRGRVTSLNTLATVGGPRLGDVEAGLAAALMGIRGSIMFGGLACLVLTAVVAVRYPELRKFTKADRPASREGQEPPTFDEGRLFTGGKPDVQAHSRDRRTEQ